MREQYGPKWEREIMKLSKKQLVQMIKDMGTRQHEREIAAKALRTYRQARDNCRAIGGRTHDDAAREYQNICYFLRKEYRVLGISRVSEDWEPQ